MAISVAWLGAVTTTTAVVKARSDQASVSATTDPATSTFNGTEGSDDVFTIELTGLTANTAYEVTVDDGVGTWVATFTTFPSGAASFVIAVGGDSGATDGEFDVSGVSPTSPAWDAIAVENPLLFVHLGDLHYKDIATDSVGLFRTAYQEAIADDFAAMAQSVPVAYVWDDHDFGPDNSNTTSASKPAAQEAYRDYVPHYPLSDPEGIWQTFTVGRVRFILTDSRSDRTVQSATDDASKTMLGADQKAWLFNLLETATEPLIVLVFTSFWIHPKSTGADAWGGYTTERQEIAAKLTEEGWTDKAIIVSADAHMLAADDGRNSQYDPATFEWGPPVLQAAPLDAGIIVGGGPYSEGVVGTSEQQYALMDFIDDGDTITVAFTGKSIGAADTDFGTYTFAPATTGDTCSFSDGFSDGFAVGPCVTPNGGGNRIGGTGAIRRSPTAHRASR